MHKKFNVIGKLCLCASLITSSVASTLMIQAAEQETGTWTLHGASLLNTSENAAYVNFASDRKPVFHF